MKRAVVKPPKNKFSWTEEIGKIAEKSEIETSIEYAKTIRERLSRDVKLKFPGRVFETETVGTKLILRRTA